MQTPGHREIIFENLRLFVTDRQVNQFRHSFTVADNFGEEVVDEIIRSTNGGVNTSSPAFSKTVGSVLAYDAGGDRNQAVRIDGDWDEPRIRWQLRAKLKQFSRIEEYILSGWTNHDGVIEGSGGSLKLDPNMVLYVNSVQVIKHEESQRGISKIMSNDQVMLNTDKTHTEVSMRPNDNLNRITVADLVSSSASAQNPHSSLRGVKTLDSVLTGKNIELNMPRKSDFNTRIETSRRTNTNANTYLQTQVKAISDAQVQRRIGSERSNLNLDEADDLSVYAATANKLNDLESDVTQNLIFDRLGTVSDIFHSGSFTIAQLQALDTTNSLSGRNVIQYKRPNYNGMDSCNIATGNWKSSNNQTMIAATIRDSLPSILIDAQINHIRMVFTNRNLAMENELHPIPIDTGRGGERSVPMLTSFQNVNVENAWNFIQNKFMFQIAPLITKNGQLEVEVDIEMNIDGNMLCGVKIGEAREFDIYPAAMYADRLTTPIITDNINNANMVAHVVNNIAESITTQKIDLLDRNGVLDRSGHAGIL